MSSTDLRAGSKCLGRDGVIVWGEAGQDGKNSKFQDQGENDSRHPCLDPPWVSWFVGSPSLEAGKELRFRFRSLKGFGGFCSCTGQIEELGGLPRTCKGKPRLAVCRMRMRGFGDDSDSLTGLMVLSHKPAFCWRERDSSVEKEEQRDCVPSWKLTHRNWTSGRDGRESASRQPQGRLRLLAPWACKEGVDQGRTGARGAGTSQICRRRQSHTTLPAAL